MRIFNRVQLRPWRNHAWEEPVRESTLYKRRGVMSYAWAHRKYSLCFSRGSDRFRDATV